MVECPCCRWTFAGTRRYRAAGAWWVQCPACGQVAWRAVFRERQPLVRYTPADWERERERYAQLPPPVAAATETTDSGGIATDETSHGTQAQHRRDNRRAAA